MINLLKETEEELKINKRTPEEIIYIGYRDGCCCTWKQFQEIANFEYDNGYGGNAINGNLIIVFKDKSFIARGEYDGSEWWDYWPVYKRPKMKDVKALTRDDLYE